MKSFTIRLCQFFLVVIFLLVANVTQLSIVSAVDPIADPKTVVTPVGIPIVITLSGSDIETSELTFSTVSIADPPLHGTLSSITNQACVLGVPNTDTALIIYTPTPLYRGSASFTYKVTD